MFPQKDLWLSVTFLPSSETTTQVRYDLFDCSTKAMADHDVLASIMAEVIHAFVKEIERKFQSVARRTVDNSSNTQRILDLLQEHQKREKMERRQILPAMRQPKGSSLFQKAEQREFL